MEKNFKKIKKVIHKDHINDFDGSWEAHNCYVEKCEYCDELPGNCHCDNESIK